MQDHSLSYSVKCQPDGSGESLMHIDAHASLASHSLRHLYWSSTGPKQCAMLVHQSRNPLATADQIQQETSSPIQVAYCIGWACPRASQLLLAALLSNPLLNWYCASVYCQSTSPRYGVDTPHQEFSLSTLAQYLVDLAPSCTFSAASQESWCQSRAPHNDDTRNLLKQDPHQDTYWTIGQTVSPHQDTTDIPKVLLIGILFMLNMFANRDVLLMRLALDVGVLRSRTQLRNLHIDFVLLLNRSTWIHTHFSLCWSANSESTFWFELQCELAHCGTNRLPQKKHRGCPYRATRKKSNGRLSKTHPLQDGDFLQATVCFLKKPRRMQYTRVQCPAHKVHSKPISTYASCFGIRIEFNAYE